ncbi:hypothetical protein MHYP_G00267460 [Metynnis hypsauchen]
MQLHALAPPPHVPSPGLSVEPGGGIPSGRLLSTFLRVVLPQPPVCYMDHCASAPRTRREGGKNQVIGYSELQESTFSSPVVFSRSFVHSEESNYRITATLATSMRGSAAVWEGSRPHWATAHSKGTLCGLGKPGQVPMKPSTGRGMKKGGQGARERRPC